MTLGVNRRRQVLLYVEQTIPHRISNPDWEPYREGVRNARAQVSVPQQVRAYLEGVGIGEYLIRQIQSAAEDKAERAYRETAPEPSRWVETPGRDALISRVMRATEESELQAVLADVESWKTMNPETTN